MSHRFPRALSTLLATLTLCLVLMPKAGYGAMEHHFLYFPDKTLVGTPALAGLEFEDVSFPAADGVSLHGWLVPGKKDWPLILFCHGNAGNISHRIDNLLLFHRLGVSVFIFDYREYGQSAGTASEEGTYQDVRGALRFLQSRGWQPERMIYFGRSMGAAVALQLALEAPPAGLVLESPFPSISAMGWHHYPVLYFLLGWIFSASYDNLDKISRLHAPLLIFLGKKDLVVPEKMARKLFARANEPKAFHLIDGAGHNDTYVTGAEVYWNVWRNFLRQLFPGLPEQLPSDTSGGTP